MSKHLDLSGRNTILLGIESGQSFSSIAARLNLAPSTLSREVRKHRYESDRLVFGRVPN